MVGTVPGVRRWAISLLAKLTLDGMWPSVVLDGAVDRLVFDQFIGVVLIPQLRPRQIVVLVNLNVHRSARAEALLASAAGCERRFLPRYSPDKNPIE